MDLSRTKLYKAITDTRVSTTDVWSMFNDYISTGKNINLRDIASGASYLHVVVSHAGKFCSAQGVSVVYLVGVSDFDLDAVDGSGDTCLHRAVRSAGAYRIIAALIRCGADPRVKDGSGRTAEDILRQDHPAGWEENLHWLSKFTPGLCEAVTNNNVDVIERLLKFWCRTKYVRNGKHYNFLDVVERTDGQEEDTGKIFQKYTRTNEFAVSMLAGVNCSTYDIDISTRDHSYQLTSSPSSPEVPRPLLAAAWESGLGNSVDILLQAGVDAGALFPSSGAGDDTEPLFFHILYKDAKLRPSNQLVYRILFKSNLAARNQKGETILYKAIAYDYPEHFIRTLIQYGVNIASRDRKGRTARDYAAQMKRTKHFNVIDDYVLNLITNSNVSELESLVLESYEHILDLTDGRGFNLSKILHEHPVLSIEMGRFLWKISAIQDHLEKMFRASESGSASELQKFISRKFSVARDKCGRTVLHRAIKSRSKEVIKMIVENYPDIIDTPDSIGRTPLHYAYLIKGGPSLAGYLLFKGADATAADVAGRRAEDYSIENIGQDEYVNIQKDVETFSMDVYLEETNFERSLTRAIRMNDLDQVKVLVEGLKDKGDINRYTHLLFRCVDTGKQDIAVYLIRQGMRTDIYKQYESCDPNSSSCAMFSCDHSLISLHARAKRCQTKHVLVAMKKLAVDTNSEDGVDGATTMKQISNMDQFTTLGLV